MSQVSVNYKIPLLADILSVPKAVLLKWEKTDKLRPLKKLPDGMREYDLNHLMEFDPIRGMYQSDLEQQLQERPKRPYRCIELFAGGGGLALGLENAGFCKVLLNDFDRDSCESLKINRPTWNIVHDTIHQINFKKYEGQIDLLSGGFPCQAFSYAGNKLGFEDTRGTLFFEYARAAIECKPKILLAENVRGLISHDGGKTLEAIKNTIKEIGYTIIDTQVLKAMFYKVPQKRERLFLVAVRNDLMNSGFSFTWPSFHYRIMTMRDALFKGDLYDCDVPQSEGQLYPKRKKEILSYVPQGGFWKDLPDDLQREYMQKSYYFGGGKTGMARRLSLDEPSLTLTCAPAQKQTERCHPLETRPLSVREYARVQTFPDNWKFSGVMNSQYKQIGNAVPVNLAHAVGCRLVNLLNQIEDK